MRNFKPLLPTLLALLLPVCALAQSAANLNLFEATEQPPSEAERPREARPNQVNHEPAFTLKGTGRFGDRYFTNLQSRSGESVQVTWREGQQSQIPGSPGYSLLDVNPRSVSLALPGQETCVPNPAKGVACSNDSSIAILSLATAAPLPSRQPAQELNAAVQALDGEQPAGGDTVIQDGQEFVVNPFSGELQPVPQLTEEEMQAREERARRRQEALRNFQPLRIGPEDVPPGMRVIRTPFGDRLVRAEE